MEAEAVRAAGLELADPRCLVFFATPPAGFPVLVLLEGLAQFGHLAMERYDTIRTVMEVWCW